MSIENTLDNLSGSQMHMLAKVIIRQLDAPDYSLPIFDMDSDIAGKPISLSAQAGFLTDFAHSEPYLESLAEMYGKTLEQDYYTHSPPADIGLEKEPDFQKHSPDFPIIAELIEQLPTENVKAIESSLTAALAAASENKPLTADMLNDAFSSSGLFSGYFYGADNNSHMPYKPNNPNLTAFGVPEQYGQNSQLYIQTGAGERLLDKGSRMNEMSEFFRKDSRRYDSPFQLY